MADKLLSIIRSEIFFVRPDSTTETLGFATATTDFRASSAEFCVTIGKDRRIGVRRTRITSFHDIALLTTGFIDS
ncbi:hypothetical protein A3711_02075 [Erythrobacter sp. HI00D59]|nr:hypothetical protein A3711_02075 [Erythrobacter sp. HI00D59]